MFEILCGYFVVCRRNPFRNWSPSKWKGRSPGRMPRDVDNQATKRLAKGQMGKPTIDHDLFTINWRQYVYIVCDDSASTAAHRAVGVSGQASCVRG